MAQFNAGIWPHLVAYSVAAALYMVAAWAPGLNSPEWPWSGCLWCVSASPSPSAVAALLSALWLAHYVRRIYETVALFSFQRARSPSEVLAFVWYGLWSFYMGLANRDLSRLPTWPPVIIGALVFSIGEAGNALCHYMLARQRHAANASENREVRSSSHVIPTGFAFEWFVAPHYVFEFIAWVGWFIACGSIAALLFAALSLAMMLPRAIEADSRYKAEFGPLYTKLHRRLIIPGLL